VSPSRAVTPVKVQAQFYAPWAHALIEILFVLEAPETICTAFSRYMLLLGAAALASAATSERRDPLSNGPNALVAGLPLRFEANLGQMDPSILMPRTPAATACCSAPKVPSIAFGSRSIAMSLDGSNRSPRIEPLDLPPHPHGLFIWGP